MSEHATREAKTLQQESSALIFQDAAQGPRWSWGEQCEEEGMVNCAFGEFGGCINPRHRGEAIQVQGAQL